jgi:hypothetical protein
MGGSPIEAQQVLITGETSTVVFEATAPPQPVETEPQNTGRVYFSSDPSGAEILINNQQHGTTPATLSLAAGRYEIVLGLSGYQAHIDSLTVTARTFDTVEVELVPIPTGLLELRSNTEGATVTVDGKNVGVIPLPGMLQLTQGYHTIELQKTGFRTETRQIFIQSDSTLTITIDLIPPLPR